MSFTSQIKEEISQISDSARHCRLAEMAALCVCEMENTEDGVLRFKAEQPFIRQTLVMLLSKLYNIQDAVPENGHIIIKDEAGEIVESLKKKDAGNGVVSGLLLQQSCCKRAYLRGMFLCGGSVSDPRKGYHLEIVCQKEETADQLCGIFADFEVQARKTERKGRVLVYIKESEAISEALNIIGAHRSLMELENLRIEKDLRNDTNRRVNCDTANIEKMLEASERQLEDIRFLKERGLLGSLPEGLKIMAEIRLENPELKLKDLGALMDPPIGKSGVNHRLRRLSKLAEEERNK
ncbi:MAG: DNA-binding protein WhiA [Lachnospiraceae bacterium]|nr:DNA-binding protein WhiA [Lachnospiraceae bacterium]